MKVGIVRPIVTFYAGVIALLAVMRVISYYSPLASYSFLWIAVLYCALCVVGSSLKMRSVLIEKCLQIDRRHALMQLIMSMVFAPLYPVIGLSTHGDIVGNVHERKMFALKTSSKLTLLNQLLRQRERKCVCEYS